jgi:hypothetical protein
MSALQTQGKRLRQSLSVIDTTYLGNSCQLAISVFSGMRFVCTHQPKIARGLCRKCYYEAWKTGAFQPWIFTETCPKKPINLEKFWSGNKRLHTELIRLLGGRCSDPNCHWVNDDGTKGCTDLRCLQVDHKHGGGHKTRREAGGAYNDYKKAVADPERSQMYQVLCANCNWVKRHENKEHGKS